MRFKIWESVKKHRVSGKDAGYAEFSDMIQEREHKEIYRKLEDMDSLIQAFVSVNLTALAHYLAKNEIHPEEIDKEVWKKLTPSQKGKIVTDALFAEFYTAVAEVRTEKLKDKAR